MLRATFWTGARRLRSARFSPPSRKQPAQCYDVYAHKPWKLSFRGYARTVWRPYRSRSSSRVGCGGVRFSGRFRKHPRLCVSTGS